MRKSIAILLWVSVLAAASAAIPPTWYNGLNTGTSHMIGIPVAVNPNIAGIPLLAGDYIGVFYDTTGGGLACSNYQTWDGVGAAVPVAWGDDGMVPGKAGFSNGEYLKWKIWRAADGKEFSANATFDLGMAPDSNKYVANGLSWMLTLDGTLTSVAVNVTAPAAAATWPGTGTRTITWTQSGGYEKFTSDTVKYSIDGGAGWTVAYAGPAVTTYDWTLPDAASANCLVRVVAVDSLNNIGTGTSGTFSIVDTIPPTVTVTSPAGGESWEAFSAHLLTWIQNDNSIVTSDSVYVSSDGGATWIGVWGGAAALSYNWNINLNPSANCQVKVVAFDAALNRNEAVSGVFTVTADVTPPAIAYGTLADQWSTAAPTLTPVTITDGSGVDITTGRARLYYKRTVNANAWGGDNTNGTDGWKYVAATGVGGSPFDFTLDYGLLFGGLGTAYDTIEYFVVAQDLAATPNVGIEAGAFNSAPISVDLQAGNFPVTGANNYLVYVPMNGDYTVGLLKYQEASGHKVSVEYRTRTVERKARDVQAIDENNPQTAASNDKAVRMEKVSVSYPVLMENGKEYDGPRFIATPKSDDGSKGVYATIYDATSVDYGWRGVDGPTRFLLNDAAYTEPDAVYFGTYGPVPTAVNTVTLKPNTGVTATITATVGYPVIYIEDQYVIIDGSNAVSGTTRDLSVTNTGTSGVGLVLANNVTVKNLIGYLPAKNQSYGFLWNNTTNGVFENNYIYRTQTGVQVQYSTGTSNNFTARNNVFGSAVAGDEIWRRGIGIYGTTGFTVENNEIAAMAMHPDSATTIVAGLYVWANSINGTVLGNKIHNVKHGGAGTVYGIRLANASATSNVTVANNLVYDVNGTGANGLVNGLGIGITAGGGYNLYYNSVNMTGNVANGTTPVTAALRIAAAASNLDIRDNILANRMTCTSTQGLAMAIYCDAGAITTIDYNNYYVTGANAQFGYMNGTDLMDLSELQTATGQDVNSKESDPQYFTASELRPVIGSGALAAGTPVSITTDYTGAARSVTTPSIGAYETGQDVSAPVITYSPIPDYPDGQNPALVGVGITDATTGIDSTSNRPRVYYKRLSNANTYNDNTNGTDGWKYVVATGTAGSPYNYSLDLALLQGGAAAAHDTIEYFVVAQDLSVPANVAINSGTFATTPSSVDLAVGNFPIGGTINSYIILGPMSGDFTVGLLKFQEASGRKLTVEFRTRPITRKIREVALVDGIGKEEKAANVESANGQMGQYPVLMENGKEYTGPKCVTIKGDGGSKGVYATITDALNDYYNRGVDGPTRFLLNDATYNEPSGVYFGTSGPAPTAVNTVTLKPNTGVTALITANTTFPTLDIEDNYVTIDGSNAVGGTTRDLTVTNTATGGNTGVAFLYVGNITVKNIIGYCNTPSAGMGIWCYGASDALIENNLIYRVSFGMQSQTSSINITARNNVFGSSTPGDNILNYGIAITATAGFTVSGNEVFSVARSAGAPGYSAAGILATGATTNGTITGNRVHNIKQTDTGVNAFASYGIRLYSTSATANITAANNLIYDINSDGINGTNNATGIGLTAGGGYNLYYNSVNLTGNVAGGTTPVTSALRIAAAAANLDIRDNIFANSQTTTSTQGLAMAINCGAAAITTIDYNDYYATGANAQFGYMNGSDLMDLSELQAATGQDVNSKEENPRYYTDSNLDLSVLSDCRAAGTPIAGITTDYAGITRSLTTPSMGAYESTTPTAVELTSFTAATTDLEKTATVSWTTASELGSAKWIVERSNRSDGGYAELGSLNAAGNSSQAVSYTYQDKGLQVGQEYYYRLAEVDLNGKRSFFGPVKVIIAKPGVYGLSQSYPNPVADKATIRYQLKDAGKVNLSVYNLTGQLVKTLVNASQTPDYYKVQWNGRNDANQKVAAGVYLYRLQVNEFSSVKKATVLR